MEVVNSLPTLPSQSSLCFQVRRSHHQATKLSPTMTIPTRESSIRLHHSNSEVHGRGPPWASPVSHTEPYHGPARRPRIMLPDLPPTSSRISQTKRQTGTTCYCLLWRDASLVAWTPSGMSVCPFRKGGLERFDRRLKLDVTANNIQYGRYSSDESFKVFLVLPHGFLRLRCWWIISSRSVKGQR